MAEFQVTEEQARAINEISDWASSPLGTVISLQGVAGSGKTTTTKILKDYLPEETCWSAMTGKAAHRLSELAEVDAVTLHSAIYKPPFQNGKYLNFAMMRKPHCKLLVIDEASMIGPSVWSDLSEWVRQGVKILFIGDGYQLPPITTAKEEAKYGQDFIIFKEVKGPTLTKVVRSQDNIVDIVTKIRLEGKIPATGNDSVKIQYVPYPGLASINDYLADREDHILITWTNKMRMQGNSNIRKKLGYNDKLPMKGEPILVRKNGQDRLNGEIIYADSWAEGPKLSEMKTMWLTTLDGQDLLVNVDGQNQFMDGILPNMKDWKQFHWYRNKQNLPEPVPITYGYVYTFHLIQGNQARRATIYLSDRDMYNVNFNKDTRLPDGSIMPFNIRALYTGATRPKEQLSMYFGIDGGI